MEDKPAIREKEVEFACPRCGEQHKAVCTDGFSSRDGAQRRATRVEFKCEKCGYAERSSRVTTIIEGKL